MQPQKDLAASMGSPRGKPTHSPREEGEVGQATMNRNGVWGHKQHVGKRGGADSRADGMGASLTPWPTSRMCHVCLPNSYVSDWGRVGVATLNGKYVKYINITIGKSEAQGRRED